MPATWVPNPPRYRPRPAGLGLERSPVGCSVVCLRYRYPVPLTATTLRPPPYEPRSPPLGTQPLQPGEPVKVIPPQPTLANRPSQTGKFHGPFCECAQQGIFVDARAGARTRCDRRRSIGLAVVTQRSRLSGTSLRSAAFVVLPNSESGVARLRRQSCVNACRLTALCRQAARERFRAQLGCVFIDAWEFAAGRLVTKRRPRVLAAFSIHGARSCRDMCPGA